jgi:hypothetical protein
VRNTRTFPLALGGRGVISAFFIAVCFLCIPAHAQTGYYNIDQKPAAAADADTDKAAPAAHSFVVTSIEKCYAQLGHTEAVDIEQHFDKPYEECQRRLALKIKQQHEIKPGQQKTVTATSPIGASPNAAPAVDPAQPPVPAPLNDEGLYFRVQKNALPSPSSSADDNTPPPAAAPYGVPAAAPVYKYNR